VAITASIHGTAIDWTLGALLFELALRPKSAATTLLVGDASQWPLACVFVPKGCRGILKAEWVPYWCLLPLGWLLVCVLLAWAIGCASCCACFRRWSRESRPHSSRSHRLRSVSLRSEEFDDNSLDGSLSAPPPDVSASKMSSHLRYTVVRTQDASDA